MKKTVFASLDKVVTAQSELVLSSLRVSLVPRVDNSSIILASSTSNIPSSSFTEELKCRAQCLVAHPVNPPYVLFLFRFVAALFLDLHLCFQIDFLLAMRQVRDPAG